MNMEILDFLQHASVMTSMTVDHMVNVIIQKIVVQKIVVQKIVVQMDHKLVKWLVGQNQAVMEIALQHVDHVTTILTLFFINFNF